MCGAHRGRRQCREQIWIPGWTSHPDMVNSCLLNLDKSRNKRGWICGRDGEANTFAERTIFFLLCDLYVPFFLFLRENSSKFAHRSVAYSTYCCRNSLAGDRMMRQPAKERRTLY